jgi:hypothetical protein
MNANARILFIITCLFFLGDKYTVSALSTDIQLTKTNNRSYYSFIVIKAEDKKGTNEGAKLFRIIVTPPNGISLTNIFGHLSIYSNTNLIVSCELLFRKLDRHSKAVSQSMIDKSAMLEFTISSNYIPSSKLDINLYDSNGPDFSDYWFYLSDFVDNEKNF